MSGESNIVFGWWILYSYPSSFLPAHNINKFVGKILLTSAKSSEPPDNSLSCLTIL